MSGEVRTKWLTNFSMVAFGCLCLTSFSCSAKKANQAPVSGKVPTQNIQSLIDPSVFINKSKKDIESRLGKPIYEGEHLTLKGDKPEPNSHYSVAGIKTFQIDYEKDLSVALWMELPYESWTPDIETMIKLCGFDLRMTEARLELNQSYSWKNPTSERNFSWIHITKFMDSGKFHNCYAKAAPKS